MLAELHHDTPAPGPGGVIARCSIARGRSVSPGIQQSPFYWRDVVLGPPPRRRQKGGCMHVTFHGSDDTGDVRIAFSTVLRVDPGADADSATDDIIHVEERLNVQRRFLQEWIDRERGFSDRMALRMRSRLAHRLVRQRRFANRRSWPPLVAVLVALIRFQAKVGDATIRATRTTMRSLVAIPDAILTHSENAGIHLGSRTGRRSIKAAFRDPKSATPAEKTVVLVLIAFGLLGGVLLLNTVFTFAPGPWARAYTGALGDFTASLLSTVALPIPAEPILILHMFTLGPVIAVLGLFLGKMVGSWMLYLLGDSLNDGIQKKAQNSPRFKRMVDWLQANADRYGFWILIPINAIPFLPDLLVLVFAVSGMRFRGFMGGIALGTLVKFIAIVLAVYAIGGDTVQQFLDHPIATIRGA